MTVTLMREQGSASLFASNKVRNPNSAFYDYRIDGDGQVYIDLEDLLRNRERRDAENGNLLFVSIEGIGNQTNTFQITTSAGNTFIRREFKAYPIEIVGRAKLQLMHGLSLKYNNKPLPACMQVTYQTAQYITACMCMPVADPSMQENQGCAVFQGILIFLEAIPY